MSLNFVKITSPITELAALECHNVVTTLAPLFLIESSSFFILAGNKDNLKFSYGFKIPQDQTKDCGVVWKNPHRLIMGEML